MSPPLRKAMPVFCLSVLCLLFTLLLAPRPAHAQGSWYGRPCDAQGNYLENWPYTWDGSYALTGSESGTISNTYPLPMINAALAYPNLYGDYLYVSSSLGGDMTGGGESLGLPSVAVSCMDSLDHHNMRVGVYTPGFASAYNYGGNSEGSYSIDAAHGGPSSGPINGSVTGDLSGQLMCYFKMSWSGPGPAPAYADFKVSTDVYAQANADYPTPPYYGTACTTGLSATATATDGSPFNETASASAGDAASAGGVTEVNGLHLVRVAVDPATMIAKVSVNATTHWVISNSVPHQTFGDATAYGGSLVEASADVASPPKSILINRPENNGTGPTLEADRNIFDFGSGEWTSYGDSRFDNAEYITAGETPLLVLNTISPGTEPWQEVQVSGPWPPVATCDSPLNEPGDWTRYWHWYAETPAPVTGVGSASGSTFSIDPFAPLMRPHVDWPYSSINCNYIPNDLLDEMQNSQAPAPQTYRVNIHHVDTDNTTDHPEYNFDHSANFFITYHNQYELVGTGASSFVTSADIPWHMLKFLGQPISQAAYSNNIVGWNPQLEGYTDTNWQVNITAEGVGAGGGQSSGNAKYIPVPPTTIPAGNIGVVYWRPHKVRIPFTYHQYSTAGRILNPDANGVDQPFSDTVMRSPLGFGTFPVDYMVFTFPNTQYPIPDPINQDPPGYTPPSP